LDFGRGSKSKACFITLNGCGGHDPPPCDAAASAEYLPEQQLLPAWSDAIASTAARFAPNLYAWSGWN
jgi:hypothetical protein